MSLSDVYENKLLDKTLGGTDFSNATVYVALCTAAPTDASTGSTIVEPTSAQYNGYARVAVTNNTTNWPAASGGSKSNGTAITFPASTGGASSPVTVTHFAVCTASSGGDVICWAALTTSRSIASGVTPSFAVGALTVSLN